MRTMRTALLGVAACLMPASGALAEEKAEQFVRDAARLAQVKTIALLPVVTQVRFDQGKDLPGPDRIAARVAAATRLPAILEEQLKGSRYTLKPPEAGTLAVKEQGWQAADLYVARCSGTWETPAETMRNKKGDQALLLAAREVLKQSPEEMTLYRFTWHDLPDVNVGLASFGMSALAKPDAEKVKALAARLGADAVLLCQVADMETHEGSAGILMETFKSTRLHLHFALLAADDGAVIWQARARGVKSQKAGIFTANRAYKGEDRKAIEAAVEATELLLSDLLEGTGKPM